MINHHIHKVEVLSFLCLLYVNLKMVLIMLNVYTFSLLGRKKGLLALSVPRKGFVFPKLILKNVHAANKFISFINL